MTAPVTTRSAMGISPIARKRDRFSHRSLPIVRRREGGQSIREGPDSDPFLLR